MARKVYRYIIETDEEVWPRKMTDGFQPWFHSRVQRIVDMNRPQGHPSYGVVYHVNDLYGNDSLENKPGEKTGLLNTVKAMIAFVDTVSRRKRELGS